MHPSGRADEPTTTDCAGGAVDRPRAYPSHAPPHTPLRPVWCCRACGQPWPCAQARLLLKAEYADDQIGLSLYLCGLLHEAARDLYRLNPDDGPAPADLFRRFVAWGPYRRPAVDPP
ncbi:hypothetical protein GCE86_28260 [Micromonospora terminaliae]|uniref:Flavin reductase n=1 Tax=Micromonospora terminaliae TaxID=1914461 RepID=A0AAJ2ZA82_9ACTN|nr:hypothetical protein [Micromonospora terminaliae]NES26397.1 hypothetical protein [Micromonospora terminaliae]QGL50575.1 hypothetical protein GCE86_28260 [Micromonospora terminaliae]